MIAIVLFMIIFMFVLFVSVSGSVTSTSTSQNLIFNVLRKQHFSNIRAVLSTSTLGVYSADNNGENYIFAIRKNYTNFTPTDLHTIHEVAKKIHHHTIVLATYLPITKELPTYRLVKEYNMEVWDYKKLSALASETSSATSSHSYSILKTSDTSDDTCVIDTNSFDPIQDGYIKTHGLFSGLFDKPDRL